MERKDVEEKYKWDRTQIYSNEGLWEEDFKKLKEMTKEFKKYKGEFNESSLIECIKLLENTAILFDKLYVYSHMQLDENVGDSKSQALNSKILGFHSEFADEVSFITPQILKTEGVEKFNLGNYSTYINNILRYKEHTLSKVEESVLAQTSKISKAASHIFNMFDNADIKFNDVKDKDNKILPLTNGTYSRYMQGADRVLRENSFKSMYKSYSSMKNTLGQMLIENTNKNVFYKKVKKYKSAREMSLFGDNVKEEVYDNLIKVTGQNLERLHEYYAYKKQVLGLDELHLYDTSAEIIKDERTYNYEEGRKIVEEALKVLGEDYSNNIERAFEERWIDVYETKGKRTGGYCTNAYEVHPYILLNYNDTLSSVTTLAHELGHAMHSHYSNTNQNYLNSEYTIFVAEVASTVNEILVLEYLLGKTRDKNILLHELDSIKSTFYRQTMFAEFEKIIHEEVENEKPITVEDMCSIYYDLNKKYFGESVVIDKEIEMEWSRIPHFYTSFYVYKYATGLASAYYIANEILKGNEELKERYLKFLKSGCTKYPLDLLRDVGVNLEETKSIQYVLDIFKTKLKEVVDGN